VTRTPTAGLRRERLSNGVTLLVQRRPAAPVAALVTLVRAGFLDEPDDLVGISHVLEHMLFKGTPTLGPGELAQRTKAIGGTLNAYTSYDRTVYYASVPVRNATELIALQADQVRNPLLDADELRRELGVIIQEARRKLDSPGAVAGETLHELLYQTHRLRRWRIGLEDTLRTFRRDQVAGYYRSRYVPERTIVALVADLDEDVALDALRANWADWSGGAGEVPAGPSEESAATVATRTLSGDVVLSELVLGWRAPGVLAAEVPALDVASAILGLGRGSRFSQRLREPGLVNAIGVSNYGVVDAGVFAIGAELDPSRLGQALQVVGDAITELAHELPSPAEFDRARTLLRARIVRRLERYESRAIALADAEALGDVTRVDREESDLLAVTPVAVRDVASQWLMPEGVSSVAYLPRGSDVRFDMEILQRSFAGGDDGRAHPAVVLSEASDLRTQLDTIPGSPSLRAGRQGSHSRLTTHDSGPLGIRHISTDTLDILTARFGDVGQTTLSIYRERNVVETVSNAGTAALAMRAMVRGTEQFDASALAFAMESLGGTLSPSLGADALGLGSTVLTEHVAKAASLLAEVLYHPRLDVRTIEIERALLIEDARAVADDMVRFPLQLALGVAFHDEGYGSPTLGTPDSLAGLTAASVHEWHGELVQGGRTTIVAVGDGDPERVAHEIAAAFGGVVIPGTTASAGRTTGSGLTAASGVTAGSRIERRDRKQSALAMIFPGPSRADPDRFAAETWSGIAAGLGGRLFESLRSARSLAYSVMANSWQRRRAGALITYIATDPVRLEEARTAMLEELAVFRREPPSAEELARATAMLAGHVEMSRQTAGSLAGEIADAWLLGEGLVELENPAAPYRAVTAEAVHAVAARSLDPVLRAEGVVAAIATE
jgi:zinc protease